MRMADKWYGGLIPRPHLTKSLVQAFIAIDPNFMPLVWDYEAYKADARRRGEGRQKGTEPEDYR